MTARGKAKKGQSITQKSALAVGAARTANTLLDATSALMAERNSANLSFGDISERSGVNSALIRYHFGSKEGLFRALLDRDAGGTFSELQKLVNADMNAIDKLRHHIHGVIKVYFRYPYMNRLVGALSIEGESDTARFIAERFTRPLADAQRAILAQGLAEKTFRSIDPMLFYFSLIGACDHLFHARHSLKFAFGIDDIDDDLRRRYADHVTDLLLSSVLVRPVDETAEADNRKNR